MHRIMNRSSTFTQAFSLEMAIGPARLVQGAAKWRLLEALPWLQVGEDGLVPDFPAGDPIIVPLRLWQLRREDLVARPGPLGVSLDPHDDPAAITADLDLFAVIAVHFRHGADDRGNSVARLLREQHGYQGELRAVVGAGQHGWLVDLFRHGFDTLSFWSDNGADGTLATGTGFSTNRQALAEGPLPLIRHGVEAVAS